MPIDWPEPFGLVMIEAMACGTPVIAFNRGSVPEVIDDGVTGFIVEDETGAIGAVDRLAAAVARRRSAQRFEERFTARRMAQDYLAVYRSLMEQARAAPAAGGRRRRVAQRDSRCTGSDRERCVLQRRVVWPRFRHQRSSTARTPAPRSPARPRNARRLPKWSVM